MSPKYSSLAIDEFVEFDSEISLEDSYEPHLEVYVNVNYRAPKLVNTSSDALTVTGSITVSF